MCTILLVFNWLECRKSTQVLATTAMFLSEYRRHF